VDRHLVQLLNSHPRPAEAPADLDLALTSVVRELARLRIQVEALQFQIDDLLPTDRNAGSCESCLSVVGEAV
jgi:hypothetical protein